MTRATTTAKRPTATSTSDDDHRDDHREATTATVTATKRHDHDYDYQEATTATIARILSQMTATGNASRSRILLCNLYHYYSKKTNRMAFFDLV